jgi:hypothetical protein
MDITINGISLEFNIQDIDTNKVFEFFNNAPYYLDSEKDDIRYENVNAWTDQHYKPYLDSYFEICFETFIYGEHKSLTEKIFKPIINFMPFLFIGFPGGLQLLRDLGFKTFSGFIDETYDTVENIGERYDLIYKEVQRLTSMSKNEIHQWYVSMKDILIYNHTHLLNSYKEKCYGEELINEFKILCNIR